ncbi:MAG TPA: hypothetical protein VI796_00520 [Candidatus Thermoplasmatota archaeon]|nr:hypothetical protein [Candidatus Thermoplasmatota archaeon]
MTKKHDPKKDAEHAHQDPRGGGSSIDPKAKSHVNTRNLNYGEAKVKQVGRMDRVVNWFRRGRGR